MAFIFYPDGFGGSTGDSLATISPLMATHVLYVDSVTGDNAYDGVQRSKPKATIAGAYAAAANGTVIVCLESHTEATGSVVNVTLKNITIAGEGSSDGEPTATVGGAANVRLSISGDDCQIRGLKFTTSSATNVNTMVQVTGQRFSAVGCRFEMTGTDSVGLTLDVGADYATIDNCTIISTSETIASTPTNGVLVATGGDGLEIYDTVFSDGLYGFTGYAFSYSLATFDNIRAHNVSLLLGAEMNVGTATYGYIHVGMSTGGGRVL
jgi:hypothetical protein